MGNSSQENAIEDTKGNKVVNYKNDVYFSLPQIGDGASSLKRKNLNFIQNDS